MGAHIFWPKIVLEGVHDMKLIVQVPCYNEEATLPLVINSIPMKIPGIDTVETMIIDDGSVDRTVEVAKKLGVTHNRTVASPQLLRWAFMSRSKEALTSSSTLMVTINIRRAQSLIW
jgi:glycosyltransferase involved in cell wall biosynthesis